MPARLQPPECGPWQPGTQESRLLRCSLVPSCSSVLGRFRCFFRAGMDFKHFGEVGNGQHFARALVGAGQLEVATSSPSRGEQTHQNTQATAIDVAYSGEIQDQHLFGLEQFLGALAQMQSLVAEYQPAYAVQDSYATNFAGCDAER